MIKNRGWIFIYGIIVTALLSVVAVIPYYSFDKVDEFEWSGKLFFGELSILSIVNSNGGPFRGYFTITFVGLIVAIIFGIAAIVCGVIKPKLMYVHDYAIGLVVSIISVLLLLDNLKISPNFKIDVEGTEMKLFEGVHISRIAITIYCVTLVLSLMLVSYPLIRKKFLLKHPNK